MVSLVGLCSAAATETKPGLFDFIMAWNHGPVKGVEMMRCYIRFRSQSQQKWVSGFWADNANKGVLAFQRQGWCYLYGQSDQQHVLRGTSLVPTQLFQFGSVKCQRHFVTVVVLTRQISAVVWDSVQALELSWDWITTGFSNLSLNSVPMISLCPWTNYIPSLSFNFLIFKGDTIIVPLDRVVRIIGDNSWKLLAHCWAQSQLSINRSNYDYLKSICLLKWGASLFFPSLFLLKKPLARSTEIDQSVMYLPNSPFHSTSG